MRTATASDFNNKNNQSAKHLGGTLVNRSSFATSVALMASAMLAWPMHGSAAAAVTPAPIVQTSYGDIQGKLGKGARAYLGIPYAAAPIGHLRWQSPQPPARWAGTRDGTVGGSPCLQPKNDVASSKLSEDCLFLNVYTPDDAGSEKLPVLVWIHGGGFMTGQGNAYDLSTLARKAHAVVVSINYRLGVFGFFRLPGSREQGAAANLGLQDQQAALRWIKTQIAPFGGDPSRVTLFGHSAGSAAICMHMQASSSAGLFHGGILQSGLCRPVSTPSAQALEQGSVALGESMGCPPGPSQLECMKGKSGVDVLTAAMPPGDIVDTGLVWSPVLDGITLTTNATQQFKSGQINSVPVIVGTTHDEGRYYVAMKYHLPNLAPVNTKQYNESIVRAANGDQAFAQKLAGIYTTKAYGTRDKALSALSTDLLYACGAMDDAQALTQRVPTYHYEFTETKTPGVIDPFMAMGAFHAVEMRYLFQEKLIGPVLNFPLSAAQQRFADLMVSYWGHFAATGNPNFAGAPTWPVFDRDSSKASSLALGSTGIKAFSADAFKTEHHCDVWANRLF